MIRRAPGWLLAALLLAALLWPPAAGAHSLLIDSSLPDGAVLDAPPAEVVLRFSEPINPAFSSVTLYAESGVDIGLARPQFPAADTLRVALPEIMRPGSYTLAYKVLSGADGHVGYGSLLFSVGTGAPPVAAGVQLPTLAGPAPELA